MDVQKMLESYISLQTKLGLLLAENGYIEISAQVLSIMPKGTDVSNPIEAVINSAFYNKQEIKIEIAKITFAIAQVEELIKSKILNENERFVLKAKYVDAWTWKELQQAYEKEKNVYLTKEAFQKCRNAAIVKLQKWVDSNLKP